MPDIDARTAKAFDIATDVSKQLLTLSTAIFAVVVVFNKDIVPITDASRHLLSAGWITMLFSMLCGAAVLMNCAGQLGNIEKIAAPSVYAFSVRLCAVLQILTFVVALALVVYATQQAL